MNAVIAVQSRDRGSRDDRAAALFAHDRNRVLDAEENRAQQDREGAVPIFARDVLDRSDRAAEAGIVVDDVEVAEFLDRAIDIALT